MRISIYKIFLLIAISLSFCTCQKSFDDMDLQIESEAAALSFIHAVPLDRNLDIYLSGNKITNNDFTYGTRTDYRFVQPGSKTIKVALSSSTYNLKTETFTLSPKNYSLFVVNDIEEIEFLLLEDDRTIPPAGKAKVRFVNLCPDMGPLDLEISAYGRLNTLATNIPFKNHTPFILVDPAYDISFFLKDNDGRQTVFGGTIEAGKTYTIWAKGLKNPSSNLTPFHGAIFEHK